ncbi:ATP synthase subunit G atp20 [Orbilia javanica]|uniref:ATP synthase subunit G atp20 n=1 Tax=Orbilia javanica TaxID=47235 RepID=A0AAN8MWB3_9PEZI
MSSITLRPLARRHHQIIRSAFRRYATESAAKSTAESAASSASSAASKAQETASNVAAKAQEIFNKGVAAAGPMAAKLGESINSAPASGNKIVGAVQGVIPHVVYYSKVAAELAKHIYRGQQMSPPSVQSFQTFYRPYVGPLLNPSSWWGHIKSIRPRISALPDPETAYRSVQGTSRKELAGYAVLAAECLGFFTVGTMIGRRKIVGYRGGVKEHH